METFSRPTIKEVERGLKEYQTSAEQADAIAGAHLKDGLDAVESERAVADVGHMLPEHAALPTTAATSKPIIKT